MRWLFAAGSALALLIVGVVATGMTLPRDRAVAVTAWINAPPDTVWSTLSDPSRYPKWRKDEQTIEMLPPAPTGPAWRDRSRRGEITIVMDADTPSRHLVTRMAGDDVPYGGTWECVVEPDGASRSRVTITERRPLDNPVVRFVSRFLMGDTAMIDGYLRELGEHFGREPIPAVVPVGARDSRHGV